MHAPCPPPQILPLHGIQVHTYVHVYYVFIFCTRRYMIYIHLWFLEGSYQFEAWICSHIINFSHVCNQWAFRWMPPWTTALSTQTIVVSMLLLLSLCHSTSNLLFFLLKLRDNSLFLLLLARVLLPLLSFFLSCSLCLALAFHSLFHSWGNLFRIHTCSTNLYRIFRTRNSYIQKRFVQRKTDLCVWKGNCFPQFSLNVIEKEPNTLSYKPNTQH